MRLLCQGLRRQGEEGDQVGTRPRPEEARARRIREGVPPAVIESILAIGAYHRAGGKTATIADTIQELTGRPPRTVAEFIKEHASTFRG